jgi:ATP-binding cassette subfamily B protein
VIARQTSDLDAIKELLASGGNEAIAGLLYMLFTATALVLLDPSSFAILVVSWVPLFLLTKWFQVNSKIKFRASRVASAKLIVNFVETMTGIKAVQAYRREPRNAEIFSEVADDYESSPRPFVEGVDPLAFAAVTPVTIAAGETKIFGPWSAANFKKSADNMVELNWVHAGGAADGDIDIAVVLYP